MAARDRETKTNIIRAGNSQGVRVRKARRPREGWAEQFKAMAERGDDQLLDEDLTGKSNWDLAGVGMVIHQE